MDLFFRIITLLLFGFWQFFWRISEVKADKEKPKSKSLNKIGYLRKYKLHYVFYFLLCLQIAGLPVLTINYDTQLAGVILVIIGLIISISARVTLGTNWAHAAEYQIKKNQTLITNGIYKYIRNPIYTGLAIGVTGGELVANSYLFLLFPLFFFIAYKQAKLEEKILEKHFGKSYTEYKKKSKMLIPFVF